METFAVLLPLTSRGCTEAALENNIITFLNSLVAKHDYSTMGLCLYVGVDVGDLFFAPWKGTYVSRDTDRRRESERRVASRGSYVCFPGTEQRLKIHAHQRDLN